MATKLSKADYVTYGYGQVEPNHLSAQRTGQIYAQLPMDIEHIDVLENGQFAYYDYASGKVTVASGAGEQMLVFNEVKVYEDYKQDSDYAMTKDGDNIVPRLFKTNVGDIFTTNTIKTTPESVEIGNVLHIGADGYLTDNGSADEGAMIWQIVKVYTMPDGQPGVKIVRIA